MKLVLANNQSKKFRDFHDGIQPDERLYEYCGLRDLLFDFGDGKKDSKLSFTDTKTGLKSNDFDGVYITGYMSTPEIAATVAIVLDHAGIPYIDREAGNAMSLTKLTGYAKLAASGVAIPQTYGGAASAIVGGLESIKLKYPRILKRADADRGIDNYKVNSDEEVREILSGQPRDAIWVIQEWIKNDGFYRIGLYHGKAEFCIFRAMGERSKPNPRKEHMFKPVGGRNASLVEVKDIPAKLLVESLKATEATNRQIASVDALYNSKSGKVHVLEVNYNPQLITIETLKDVRIKAFLKAMSADWNKTQGNKKGTGKIVLGDSEYISLPSLTDAQIPARVDTGAASCAIWVSRIKKKDGKLEVVFWGPESEEYTGKTITFDSFERVPVVSSNGGKELRYKVDMPVVLAGKKINTQFTLADRSTQTFPILIGRNLLIDNFLVDVNKGIDV